MDGENKLENLSFESSTSEIPNQPINIESNKNKFTLLLIFVLLILISSTGILAYFLFFNKQNDSLVTQLERVEKSENKVGYDFSLLNNRSDYQISIYLSLPKRDLEYLGEGVLIDGQAVLTSSQVVKDYKYENLLIKQKENSYFISKMEESPLSGGPKTWILFIKDTKLQGSINFSFKDLKIGEEYYLRSTRKEMYDEDNSDILESFNPIKVIGVGLDKSYYITNLASVEFGSPIYDREGDIVGIANGMDSKNNIKITAGTILQNTIKSSLSTLEKDNKELIGIEFEFSDLDSFRKEGRPVGLIVKAVKKGSKADLGGVEVGDIVLTINNQIITSGIELDKLFNNLNPKEDIKFEIIREDKKVGITLNLE